MDTIEIEGMKYTVGFFKAFGKALPNGAVFQIIKREDGAITISQWYFVETAKQEAHNE